MAAIHKGRAKKNSKSKFNSMVKKLEVVNAPRFAAAPQR